MWHPTNNTQLILKKQSPWQEIALYKHGKDYWMSLNGILQFHTRECYVSHQYMCRLPVMMALNPRKALIIGGGDGFAARELLKYPFIEEITNVELDADLIKITRDHPTMKSLTDGAFSDPRVKVIAGDGIGYLLNTQEKFDIIIDDCEYEYTGQGRNRKELAEKKRYDDYRKCLVTKLTVGGVGNIMEPLIRVKPPKTDNVISRVLAKGKYFFDLDGRMLDHKRYTQDELEKILVERQMNRENDDLIFFKSITPYVTYKIFMSKMIGPEAYIYFSNMPIEIRRTV